MFVCWFVLFCFLVSEDILDTIPINVNVSFLLIMSRKYTEYAKIIMICKYDLKNREINFGICVYNI